jgi:hypothetical protein
MNTFFLRLIDGSRKERRELLVSDQDVMFEGVYRFYDPNGTLFSYIEDLYPGYEIKRYKGNQEIVLRRNNILTFRISSYMGYVEVNCYGVTIKFSQVRKLCGFPFQTIFTMNPKVIPAMFHLLEETFPENFRYNIIKRNVILFS